MKSWGHGCHKCPYDGKRDNHCLSCRWTCQASNAGRSIVSLDARREAGCQTAAMELQEPQADETAMRSAIADFLADFLRVPERARAIIGARCAGLDWATIAETHGISVQAAVQAAKRARLAHPELGLLLGERAVKTRKP